LELARHPVTIALIAIGAVGGTVAAVALRPRPAAPPIEHAYAIPSADQRILVEVLNATPRPGLARAAARALRRRGLDVIFFGNGDVGGDADSTRIIARRGNRAAAERVARALGRGVVKVQIDTLRRVDVSVLLGNDYRPPADGHP
jgi:LytR cell envelope-related transcriptional attenuator